MAQTQKNKIVENSRAYELAIISRRCEQSDRVRCFVLQQVNSTSKQHSVQTKFCFYHSILALSTLFNSTRLPRSAAIIALHHSSTLNIFTHTPITSPSCFSSVSPHFRCVLQLPGSPQALLKFHIHCS